MDADTKKQNALAQRDDASDYSIETIDTKLLTDDPKLIEQEIADRQQYRQLRQYAFFGVATLTAMLALFFVAWTGSFGVRLFYSAYKTDASIGALMLTPIVIIAALVVLPLLAVIRFVFRENRSEEEERDGLTIWQTLVKELADVLKTYVGRGKPAA